MRPSRYGVLEVLAAQIANGSGVQIVDARQRDHMSRHVDLMAGATWRDPDRVEEWIAELTPDKPVAVYCAYGFDVGGNVTKTRARAVGGIAPSLCPAIHGRTSTACIPAARAACSPASRRTISATGTPAH